MRRLTRTLFFTLCLFVWGCADQRMVDLHQQAGAWGLFLAGLLVVALYTVAGQ